MEPQYRLNPTEAQDSIKEYLEGLYPHVPVIEDGIVDGDYEQILKFPDGKIKPFIILWHSTPYRAPRGRSVAHEKLDTHRVNIDVLVVANNGSDGRRLMNDVSDNLTGFKPTQATGGMVKGISLWEQSRFTLDSQNRPNRWAAIDRFSYGIHAEQRT